MRFFGATFLCPFSPSFYPSVVTNEMPLTHVNSPSLLLSARDVQHGIR